MSDLLNLDFLDQQQTSDNMTNNIFANEWMPSWEEKTAAATTFNHYSPTRQLTDDEMFEFCMSGIANVEDFIRSKSMATMFNNDLVAGSDQDAAMYANGVDTEAEDVLAAMTSYKDYVVDNAPVEENATTESMLNEQYGAIEYDNALLVASSPTTDTPAYGVPSTTTEPIGDAGPQDHQDETPLTNTLSASHGYASASVDPFASDFNPLLGDVFASMNAKVDYGVVQDVARPDTYSISAAAPDNANITTASPELAADDDAAATEQGDNSHVSATSAKTLEAADIGGDDFFSGIGDFPDFPEFDDVTVSPTTSSHKSQDTTSPVAAATAPGYTDNTDISPHHYSSVEAVADGIGSPYNHSSSDEPTKQDYKLARSTTPQGTPPATALNFLAGINVSSASTTIASAASSPKASAASSNTSLASTKSASLSNKYVSPYVSDEDDLFPPMESFDDFLRSHSSPASNTTTTPSAKPPAAPSEKVAAENVVDLTADTPRSVSFPADASAYHPPGPAQPAYTPTMLAPAAYYSPMPTQSAYTPSMPAQPAYIPAMPQSAYAPAMPAQSVYTATVPAQPAYTPTMPTQSAYTPTMPTQQYQSASSYGNTAPPDPYQQQKQIWEMSDAEIASWLASAGVPPASTPVPAPAASMPGLESPHYASTELPQAPYTSPMPRKRKASATMMPAQIPKKARVEQQMPASRPIAQPHRRQPANGIPANYSWLTTPAAPIPPVTAPPSSSGSDPAPLLAFTINGKVQGCTRICDEQWAKMYDSAVLNGGKVRMRGGRWARLWVTGRVKEMEGVARRVVAVVME